MATARLLCSAPVSATAWSAASSHSTGVGVVFRDQGGRGSYRWGTVAADRFQQNARRRDARGAELLGDQKAVLLIAYDDRRREALAMGTKRGFLQQRAVGDERPKLFGEAFARDRPEPCP